MTNNNMDSIVMDPMLTRRTSVYTFIQDELLGISSADLKEDSNLLSLGLDSLKMMRLVLFLEETFGITVKDEDVNASNMQSIHSITQLVDRYLCHTNP